MAITANAARAALRVFNIYELLEHILEDVPPEDLLLLQRTCRQFQHIITTSTTLQKKFLLPLEPKTEEKTAKNERQLTKLPFTPDLPAKPKFLTTASAIAQDWIESAPDKDYNWYLDFEATEFPFVRYSGGGTESWRQLFLCRPSTRAAVLEVFDGMKGCTTRVRCATGIKLGSLVDLAVQKAKKEDIARGNFSVATGLDSSGKDDREVYRRKVGKFYCDRVWPAA